MSRNPRARAITATASIAGALVLTASLALPALADNVFNDIINDQNDQLERVIEGTSLTVEYWIKPTGGDCDASDGSAATLTIRVPAGVRVSPSTLTFSACDTPKQVTFTADPGDHSIQAVAVTDANGDYNANSTAFRLIVRSDRDGDGIADGIDNCPDVANAGQADADGDGIGNACDTAERPANAAPVVAVAATNAHGTEGDLLSTGGRFSDPDDDALTITADSEFGSFNVDDDGGWTWSKGTNDDVAEASITVTASDGEHSVSDTFRYSAVNANPRLTMGTAGDAYGCTASAELSFTDAGSADTHVGSLSWGDGSGSAGFTGSPFSASRAYTSAGTYQIGAQLSDDDGGSDTGSRSHTVWNIPSDILQPINSTGSRSAFKLGSTIPVKIRVTDCTGALVSTLAPQVDIVKLDSTPEGTLLETVSTATPTNGTAMRYDATAGQYIYNLATKPLSVGDWKVRIDDPSFSAKVTAVFSIRK